MPRPPVTDGNSLISIELIELDTQYTLTVNPDDDHQFFSDIDRVKTFRNWMEQHLIPMFCGTVYGNIEVSPKGRLHFHGTISFKSLKFIQHLFVFNIRKILDRAHVEMDTIADAEKWDTYCNKQNKFKLGRVEYIPNVIVEKHRDENKEFKVKYRTFDEL